MITQAPDQIRLFLSMFLMQVPTFLVCAAAGIVILTKSREAPRAALWAMAGFGLVAILCVLLPLAQMSIQVWGANGIQPMQRVWAYSVLGIASSILHAVAYVFLLVAVFAGRPAPSENP